MTKQIDKMRSDIEGRIKKAIGITLGLLALFFCYQSNVFPVELGDERANSYVSGFQIGLYITLLLFYLAKVSKYRKALKDEALLQQLYDQENDERVVYVNQQVGKTAMSINTVILLFAAIVAGYYNVTVFVTIIVIIIMENVIQFILQIYHMNRVSVGKVEEE